MFVIDLLGHAYSVAGTTTKVKWNWDSWTGPIQTGTETTDLDSSGNGVLEAALTTQAIGSIVYKLFDKFPVTLEWGNSLEVDVVTSDAAAKGVSFAVGYPSAERILNASNTATASL